jgi:hypothetical protein
MRQLVSVLYVYEAKRVEIIFRVQGKMEKRIEMVRIE